MQVETFCCTSQSNWQPPSLQVKDPNKSLIIAFGASNLFDCPDLISKLSGTYSPSALVGCSTSGEIWGTEIKDESLTIGVIQFENTETKTASSPVCDPQQSFQAGESIGRTLLRPDLRGVLVLSDGLHVNGSELVRGLNSVLPESVVVTGGLAGDGDRFQRTWVLHEGKPQEKMVTAVGFYGDKVHIGHGSKGGWDIFGPERKVTRSEGNVLFELDGKPALQLYKDYLGDRADGLPATGLFFPLTIRSQDEQDKQIVRTILAVDEATQSMTFAGDIPEGSLAQLMRANFDRLVAGASQAATLTGMNTPDNQSTLAIAISCVGRRLVLGERTEEEIEATLDVLPPQTQQIGFYSYGEISPYTNGACDLHNQTMTLTTISEF